MLSLQPGQRVVENRAGIAAALRKTCRSSEVERASADVNLSEADGCVYPIVDAKVGRIQQLIRSKGDVNSVVAHANRVGKRRPENMVFAHRSNLAAGSARVAP